MVARRQTCIQLGSRKQDQYLAQGRKPEWHLARRKVAGNASTHLISCAPSSGYVESRASSSGYVESFQIRFSDFQISFHKNLRIIDVWTPGINLFFGKSISTINHHFLAPSPLKPLKSSPRYQNLLGDLLIAHSDHQGPVSGQNYLQK